MLRSIRECKQGTRLLAFCLCAALALAVANPAAYASYNHDDGKVWCAQGQRPALQVKAKGNPVRVKGYSYNGGYVVIWDSYRTYSGTTTRVYYASGQFADRGMAWSVDVPTGTSDYVSRDGTFGYCVNR